MVFTEYVSDSDAEGKEVVCQRRKRVEYKVILDDGEDQGVMMLRGSSNVDHEKGGESSGCVSVVIRSYDDEEY